MKVVPGDIPKVKELHSDTEKNYHKKGSSHASSKTEQKRWGQTLLRLITPCLFASIMIRRQWAGLAWLFILSYPKMSQPSS
jgi:hypothetical protein